MAGKLSLLVNKTAASTGAGIFTLGTGTAGSLRRFTVYDLTIGSSGTPSDGALLYQIRRSTDINTSATGTSGTLTSLDPADQFAGIYQTLINLTANPSTLNSTLMLWPMNARCTFRWLPTPGSEIVIPASGASVGIVMLTPTATKAVALAGCVLVEVW